MGCGWEVCGVGVVVVRLGVRLGVQLCGCTFVRLCGCVVVWLCGWLYVCADVVVRMRVIW